MADTAPRDQNHVPTLLAVSSVDGISPVTLFADPTSHRLLVTGINNGTVTSVSSPNGTITVATGTTTPAIDIDLTHANTWSGLQTFTNNNIGTTITDGLVLSNSTAAASGLQQQSGSTRWSGQGWKTTATAASQQVDFTAYVLPIQGTTAPTAEWHLARQISGGGYADTLIVSSSGTVTTQQYFSNAVSGAFTLNSGSTTAVSNFITAASNISNSVNTTRYQFAGSTNVMLRSAFGGSSATVNIANGNNYANVVVGAAAVLTTTTGSNPWLVNQAITALGTVTSGGGTVGNTASLYIDGASSATVTGANYALYVAAGVSSFNGDVKLSTVGNGLYIKEGSNATSGLATLAAGTVVVSTTKVTAVSRIYPAGQGGTITNLGSYSITARTPGTSFTISSSNVLDTNTVAWVIIEPA